MAESSATNPNVFDTTAATFVTDVLERSRTATVAVDFWAPWCGPCHALAPILEQLVAHYGGGLAVARVNTDEEPAIASQFGIRSIPDVRIVRDGRMVDGFVGVQPLARLRALFDRYVTPRTGEPPRTSEPPRTGEPPREPARNLIDSGRLDEAVAALTATLAQEPTNAAALVDLAEAWARKEELAQAEETLARLPPAETGNRRAESVRARIQLTRDAPAPEEAARLAASAGSADAPLRDLYRLAAHELLRGDAARGLDLLLTLLKRDRRFEDGLAQRALRQAFALLGDDDERVGQYRRRMGALLY